MSDYKPYKVRNFKELASFSFHDEVNAVCWNRELEGDFLEIIEAFEFEENMIEISEEDLTNLSLSKRGQLAREVLLKDFKLLSEIGASPTLNIIKHYERDTEISFFPTDVYSFHVDRSTIPVDTYLCTYYGAPSEIISNSEVTQKILIPAIRNELHKLHQGDDSDFENFLKEHFFDLHYQPIAGSTSISLGVGQLCRLAGDYPNNPSLPCVHRAPIEQNNEPRLLMIC